MTTDTRPSMVVRRAVNVRRRALQRRIGGRFASALLSEFRRQAQLVRARYLAGTQKAAGDVLMTPAEYQALLSLFMGYEGEMWAASSAMVGEVIGLGPDFTPISRASAERIAERVRRVDDVTRRAIRRTILANADKSEEEIADALQGVVEETYHGRHRTIARTEMAIVDQEAAHDRYAAAGITHLEIEDGASCGWTSHDDPDKADGSVRTIESANRYKVAHPNCVRSSLPILPDEVEL